MAQQPIAIVGMGAIMPDAPTGAAFWANIAGGHYSITDVPKDRWDPDLYYDPDPRAPGQDLLTDRGDGSVSSPGIRSAGACRCRPRSATRWMNSQKWAVAAAREALIDAGWPGWNVDPERVAVMIGSALGGEQHYATTLRIRLPEFTRELARSAAFASLPASTRDAIIGAGQPVVPEPASRSITEDTMPGELANIIAGTDSEPVQLPRHELHHRRRLRVRARRTQRGRRGPGGRAVRRGDHRRGGPEHGRCYLRQVLQDRGAVRHRDAAVRRRRRRVRHGRGGGAVRAQAAGRRRARRRPGLRGAARRRRGKRRQGQGDHRAESGRAAAGHRARLAERGRRPGHRLLHRGARHVNPGR